MSDPRHEPELRDRFAALRREDERQVPPFARVWQSARTRRRSAPRRRWLGAPAAAAIAACVLLVWLAWRRATPPPPPVSLETGPSLADWKPPTDFLLQTPGREILAAPGWLTRGFAAEVPDWGLGPLPTSERRAPS